MPDDSIIFQNNKQFLVKCQIKILHVLLDFLSAFCVIFDKRMQRIVFSSVQFSRSVVSDSLRPRQASLSITDSRSSLRLTSIEFMMPSSHLILGRPLLLMPPISRSIRVFSSESTLLMRWPKYWSFSFSIIPSKEIPGLISFRMD